MEYWTDIGCMRQLVFEKHGKSIWWLMQSENTNELCLGFCFSCSIKPFKVSLSLLFKPNISLLEPLSTDKEVSFGGSSSSKRVTESTLHDVACNVNETVR